MNALKIFVTARVQSQTSSWSTVLGKVSHRIVHSSYLISAVIRSMISHMRSTGQVLDSDDSKTLSFAELSVGLRKLNVSDRFANAQCKFLIDILIY